VVFLGLFLPKILFKKEILSNNCFLLAPLFGVSFSILFNLIMGIID